MRWSPVSVVHVDEQRDRAWEGADVLTSNLDMTTVPTATVQARVWTGAAIP
jgi:hypothetical protein